MVHLGQATIVIGGTTGTTTLATSLLYDWREDTW